MTQRPSLPARRDPRLEALFDDDPAYPKPWEKGLSLDEGVTWMIADEAGLDGRRLAEAGIAAHKVLSLLRAAVHAPSANGRARLAARTRAALAGLDAKRHPDLIAQVEARLESLTAQPSVNPETGVQEFGFVSDFGPLAPGRPWRTMEFRPEDKWQGPMFQKLPIAHGGDMTMIPLSEQDAAVEPTPVDLTPQSVLPNVRPEPPSAHPSNNSSDDGLLGPQFPAAKQAPLPERNPRDFAKIVQLPVPDGIERNDSAGAGWYGASRGDHSHHGVDILVNAPGDTIYSPVDGVIGAHGRAYPDYPHQIVNIEGSGPYKGLKFRVFYVDPGNLKPGTNIRAGDQIGKYHDVTIANPNSVGMKHHIHVEAFHDGSRIDPAIVLPNWTSRKP